MIKKILAKIKENPTLFYAMSIAATWANAGSLLNGVATAQKDGIVPYLLWALGNTLACIVFGLFASRIPKLVNAFNSKIMKIIPIKLLLKSNSFWIIILVYMQIKLI